MKRFAILSIVLSAVILLLIESIPQLKVSASGPPIATPKGPAKRKSTTPPTQVPSPDLVGPTLPPIQVTLPVSPALVQPNVNPAIINPTEVNPNSFNPGGGGLGLGLGNGLLLPAVFVGLVGIIAVMIVIVNGRSKTHKGPGGGGSAESALPDLDAGGHAQLAGGSNQGVKLDGMDEAPKET